MEQTIYTPTTTQPQPFAMSKVLASRWAQIVLAVIIVAAIGSRFYDLGSRALHHDESLHAYYSWEFYDTGVYKHDPLMHGPVLFHMTAFGYWLFGDSDATSRLMPALLGIFLVWVPWVFRRWLGVKGAVITSALMLISPTVMYYSRFIREDVFFAAWTVIIIYGMWKYLADGKDIDLYIMIAGWALAFSQKEVSFMLAAVLWAMWLVMMGYHWWRTNGKMPIKEMREFHLMIVLGGILLPHTAALLLHLVGMDPVAGYNETTYRDVAFLQRAFSLTLALFIAGGLVASFFYNIRKFLIAAGIFYLIFILLHTTFLTWPYGVGSGLVGALGYWIEQHAVERGGQPWYYYLMLLPIYEFLPALIGVVGVLAALFGRKLAPFVQPAERANKAPDLHLNTDGNALFPLMLFWWFGFMIFALSYAGEKMPWLLFHIALPLIFMAGWTLNRVLDTVAWRKVFSAQGIGFFVAWTIGLLSFGSLFWLAFRAEWPLQGADEASLNLSARWLVLLVLFIGATVLGVRLSDKVGTTSARQIALMSFTILLALATVRFAVIASFVNGDQPHEPLIYTQSSPDVPMVMKEIEQISRTVAGGTNLKVAFDSSTSWPFLWYLRNYPNRFYYAASPDAYVDQLRSSPVVLVGPESGNDGKVAPLLPGYIRHYYSMRPNFPEDYKNWRNVYTTVPDPNDATRTIRQSTGETTNNPFVILGNIFYELGNTEMRRNISDWYVNREWYAPLGDFAMWMYVQPDIAAQVWQYGVTVTAMDPELVRDPYAEVLSDFAPATTIAAPGIANPKGVAILPDGNLAISDGVNHKIVITEPNGTVIREFGSFGAEPGQFNEPWGIAAAEDGTLFIADTWNHRVQHVDSEGNVLNVWGRFSDIPNPAGGTFWGPRSVAIDGEGFVYISDTGNKEIEKYAPDGTFIGSFGTGGAGNGQFAEPVGVAVAPDGTIAVADTWNRRVQLFNPDFSYKGQFGVRAWSGQGLLNKPYIAATNDRVWISDPEGYRIIELDMEGTPLRVWGHGFTGTQGLNLPLGVVVGDGTLWVADSQNARVLGYPIE
jgi:uncharacterized protein (TIGR03663 family)